MMHGPGVSVALLLVVAGCGSDSAFNPDAVVITGRWSTQVHNIGEPPTHEEAIVCTATWNMQIVEAPGGSPTGFASEVPLDAYIECTDGYSSLFAHRGLDLLVFRDGATLNFVTAARMESFAIVTLVGENRLEGRMGELYYGGGDLTATR
jgi:hypothetical protein